MKRVTPWNCSRLPSYGITFGTIAWMLPDPEVTRLEIVSQTAVVIYPILLPDRTELLVSLPTGLKRFHGAGRTRTPSRKRSGQFRRKLEKRTTREYLPHAQQLYDWLIRPLEPDLTSVTIDTLVFVPDGPLRTIPMAALHDGQQFLIASTPWPPPRVLI